MAWSTAEQQPVFPQVSRLVSDSLSPNHSSLRKWGFGGRRERVQREDVWTVPMKHTL